MAALWCRHCGSWALEGPDGFRHLAGRLSAPAACLGCAGQVGQGDICPEALAHLPAAPARACDCRYRLTFSWREAQRQVAAAPYGVCALALYVHALDAITVRGREAWCGRFRVLAYCPRWQTNPFVPLAVARLMDWARATLGPELPTGRHLPTGVFDRVPPEVAALLEGVT